MMFLGFSASSFIPDFHQSLRSQYPHDEWNSNSFIIGKHHLPPDTIKITKTVAIKVPYPHYIPVPHGIPYPIPVQVTKPIPVEVPKIITIKEPVYIHQNTVSQPTQYEEHQQEQLSEHEISQPISYEENEQAPLSEQNDWQPSIGNTELLHD